MTNHLDQKRMAIVTPIRNAARVCTMVGALLAATGLAGITSVQAQTAAATPLATGVTSGGAAEAQVIEAVREGDILTIKVRFKPIVDHKTEPLYGSISKSDYENSFYVLAGNKKHLLLTDSHNQPLTNPRVILSASKDSAIAGTWYGKFPAPPKNITKVSLTIPNVETLDGIKITDR
ncbi:hypothetical protein [Burkholderia cepacia]|uniref:hypothetical protein n=1 Tax=Burkholderia cepacia TaxID=292 RepID=UPI00249EC0D2|nr:hypothetical protein [Burkholderia cepacia]